MKQFITAADAGNINSLIQDALAYKTSPLKDVRLGYGKRIGLLFLNPSLRTRISTQAAAQNLGLQSIVFNIDKEGWAMEFAEGAVMNGTTVEHIRDAAPVLGAYFDMLCIRTFPSLQNRDEDYGELVLQQFIQYAGIPVVSMESATLHPLQSLADVITIAEHKTVQRPKVVLTWAPHIKPLPQCVANSFAEWMNTWNEADFVIAHPGGYELNKKFAGNAMVTNDQAAALRGADFIYIKNWSAYNDYGEMPAVSGNWMLDKEKIAAANDAKIMHCLPVRRNVELSDELLDSTASIVTQQAANRVWAAQAVLSNILKAMK